jgi:hypothetical protein
MPRDEGEGGGDGGVPPSPSQTTNVAGVKRRKGKGSRRSKRGPMVGQPWTPSRALYGDLKIPVTEIKKKS